jgi:hypothetical protein
VTPPTMRCNGSITLLFQSTRLVAVVAELAPVQ